MSNELTSAVEKVMTFKAKAFLMRLLDVKTAMRRLDMSIHCEDQVRDFRRWNGVTSNPELSMYVTIAGKAWYHADGGPQAAGAAALPAFRELEAAGAL